MLHLIFRDDIDAYVYRIYCRIGQLHGGPLACIYSYFNLC